MRAWRAKWMRAVISAICYTGLAWCSVITPWMTEIEEAKFQDVMTHPGEHLWTVSGLVVGLAAATFTALKTLMNHDWPTSPSSHSPTRDIEAEMP